MDTDGSPATRALTFTADSWQTAQTVTATAVDDGDRSDETVTLTHALAGATEYAGGTGVPAVTVADVTVEVTDDDGPGLVLSGETLAVEENAAATYTVALNAQPNGTVTVEVRAPGASDVTVDTDGSPATRALTFDTMNWATAQTVEVRAAEDDDGRNDTVALTHAVTSSHADYAGLETSAPAQVPGVTVTVRDDDTVGVTVDTDPGTPGVQAAGLSVTEEDPSAGSDPYTLALATEPAGPVTVTVTSADAAVAVDTDGTPQRRVLTFTAESWQTAQTVTAAAVADDDGVGETVSVTHAVTSADPDYDGVSVASVTVTVTDDDPVGLAVSAAADGLTVVETESGTYTVALATQPAGSVTVGVARTSGSPDVRAEPTELTFTATTWNTGQAVTVSVADDGDADDEPPTVLSHTVTGSEDTVSYPMNLAAVTVTVTVTDDDEVGVTVDPTSVAVTEEAAGATFTVVLDTQPAAAVTVSVDNANDASAVTANGVAGNMTLDLVFATTAWNTAQTVTVRAAGDDGNTTHETETLTLSVANYPGVTTADDVTVQVTDDDAPGLVLSGGTLTVEENGDAANYTVTLTVAPGGPVTVTVEGPAGSAVTVDTDGDPDNGQDVNTLTFGTTTWNTAQTVAVRAGDDDDGRTDTVALTHAVTGDVTDPYDGLEIDRPAQVPGVTVTVTDDDTVGVTVDTDPGTPGVQAAGLSVTEEDPSAGSDPYTLALATEPAGPVTVTVTSADAAVAVDTDGTPQRRVLTFTAESWQTAQTVTAAAVADDDGVGETVSVTHAVTSADPDYDGVSVASVTVTVTDDDPVGLAVSAAADGLTVAEAASGTYTVALATEPAGPVTVGIAETPDDPDVGVSPGGPGALVFDRTNWAAAQAVTVTAQADADAADDTTTLRHRVTGSADPDSYPTTLAAVDVAVTVDDAQTAGVTATPAALDLTEDHPTRGSGSYTVRLDARPTAAVVVTLTARPAGAVTVVPGALTFGPTTWATAQAVTVTAQADADAANAEVTLEHGLTGAAEYAAVTAAVTVTVDDNEEQAVWVDTDPDAALRQTGALTLTEDHATNARATYTVELGSAPLAPVVVRVGSDNPDVHAAPGLLRFGANDWNTAQTVTVRAHGDADARADTAALTHRAAGGDYTGLAPVTVTVAVTDDDAGIAVSRGTVTVLEGETNTYTVRLRAAPAGNVEVTVTSPHPARATVGPPATSERRTLVFTAQNWRTPQVVTVTGVAAGGEVTLSHTANGYGMAAANVGVQVVNTAARLVVEPRRLTLVENGPVDTYTVRLAAQPTGTATVFVLDGVRIDPGGVIARSPSQLRFDASNWRTAQTVTLTALGEANDVGPARLRFRHHMRGGGLPDVDDVAPVEAWHIDDTTPTLDPVPNRTVRVGQAVNVRLPAATGGNAPLRYALTPRTFPAGLRYDETARRIVGAAAVPDPAGGTYTYTVTDVDGDAVPRTFTLTVEANPLGFSSGAATYTPGEPYTLPAPDVASGTPVLTFVLEPRLPAGLRYVPPTRDPITGQYGTGGRIEGSF